MNNNLDLNILKIIISNKKYAIDFTNECDAKLFESNFWNFANLAISYIKLFKEVPTLRVLIDKASKNDNLINHINEIWKKISDHQYDEKEYKHDLAKIKSRYADRELSKLSEKLAKAVDGDKIDIETQLSEINKSIFNIKSLNQTKSYGRKTLKESVEEFRDEFNAKIQNPDFDRGIMTGYSALDEATGGLRPSELILLGGESGAGKSMFLMNIALQIWMQNNTIEMHQNFNKGYNVVYFSLEMPFKPCRNRVYSRLAGIPSKLIREPISKDGKMKLSSEQRLKLKIALQFIKNYPYQFEIVDIPRGATAEQIEILFEEAKVKYNPDIVVIDYLGIMDDDSKDDDWLKLGKITGKVHELCRVHNTTILTAVQLNRAKGGGKDSEDRVGMHRIGRSALIMTHANVGIQIETRLNEKDYPDMIYHLIKVRDGGQGKGKLIKNLSCGTLLDDKASYKENDTGYEFTDIDDISEKIELLDI